MNKLESKIKEHAGVIFGSEPAEGHRDRFAGKLAAINPPKQLPIRKIIRYLSVAAVFTGCVFLAQHMLTNDRMEETESLAEVQNYYATKLQEKIDAIEQILPQVDENDRASLKQDMEDLQQEAAFNIQNSDEKNTAFVVMTYSSKIEALEHIYAMLENTGDIL